MTSRYILELCEKAQTDPFLWHIIIMCSYFFLIWRTVKHGILHLHAEWFKWLSAEFKSGLTLICGIPVSYFHFLNNVFLSSIGETGGKWGKCVYGSVWKRTRMCLQAPILTF